MTRLSLLLAALLVAASAALAYDWMPACFALLAVFVGLAWRDTWNRHYADRHGPFW